MSRVGPVRQDGWDGRPAPAAVAQRRGLANRLGCVDPCGLFEPSESVLTPGGLFLLQVGSGLIRGPVLPP